MRERERLHEVQIHMDHISPIQLSLLNILQGLYTVHVQDNQLSFQANIQSEPKTLLGNVS